MWKVLFKTALDWRTGLDVVIIAMSLFFIYHTLRRLGAWKIVSGLLLSLSVFALADFLDLKGIKWAYVNLSHVAVIGLIIIFQPELRKVFERAASLKREDIGSIGANLAALVTEAVFRLAHLKRGAIIVFPGKEPIMRFLTGGSTLNADPSLPLLMSIFDPNSPGHDGAVLVVNGKLTSFGVRLPLSVSGVLSEEFGTRHNAAMGLAEVSDALVIAVSEERGVATIFQRGNYAVADNRESLAVSIRNHWEASASLMETGEKGWLTWKVLSEFLVCLAVSLIFWVTVIMGQAQMLERVLAATVEYVGAPSNLALVGQKPTEVKLHLAGPKADLDSITPAQLMVKVDLRAAQAGRQTYVVNEDSVQLPREVKLVDSDPSSFELTLNEIVEMEAAIEPQLVGRVSPGLKISSIEVNPKSVRVYYPAAQGKKQQVKLTTTPIYLESIEDDTVLFCKVIAPSMVQPVEKKWPDVEVFIKVKGEKKPTPEVSK
ncbi:MAG: diadenylate cyclase [Pseudomonadota bacterium]